MDGNKINGLINAFNNAFANSRWREGIKYGEELAQILGIIGDKAGESGCYTNLGFAYECLGDFNKAIEYNEKSLRIKKKIGDVAGEAKCYGNLGFDYYGLGDFKKSIEYHEKSLRIFKDIGDKSGESKCHRGLGNAYNSLGDFNKAIEEHEKSLKIAMAIGDNVEKSSCYTGLGIAYHSLGDFNKAIEFHEKSREIFKDIGDKSGESKCYVNLGLAYHALGDFNKAIEEYEKSLEIKKNIGDRAGESRCYTNLGNAYHSLGDFNKAIEYYEKSQEIAKRHSDRSEESRCYVGLGITYHSLGDFNKAIKFYEKSLKIAKDIGEVTVESKCYGNLGNVYYDLGDFNKAIKFYGKSLKIAKDIGDKAIGSIVCGNFADIYYRKKCYQKSLNCAKDSIIISETIRESLIEEKLRELSVRFFESKFGVYDLGINAALKLYKNTKNQDHLKDAFEIIERTKSRELKKTLMKEEIVDVDFKITDDFWNAMSKYKDNCTVLEMYEQGDRIIYLLMNKNNKDEIKLTVYEQKIDWKILRELFVEYFTISAYLFNHLDKESSEEFIEVLKNTSDPFLNELIKKYGRDKVIVMMKDVNTFYNALDKIIAYILPKELKTDLTSIETDYLFVLPHRWLHDVSWEAINMDGEPLGLKYNLIRNYNLDLVISTLNYPQHPFNNALIVFNLYAKENGTKIYPEILEEECVAVKNKLKRYEVKYFPKEQATWDNIKKELHKASLIHFHCHGNFNPIDPLKCSGIDLYNHFVSANDILSEKIEFNYNPLILLRGCKTGRTGTKEIGQIGDEQMGLVTSFFTSKASSLIVTGWSTRSDYGKEFSSYFYNSLLDGKNVAESLKSAREKIYEKFGKESRDWAAYMLYGNPFKFI